MNDIILIHHGIKGQKWGVRRYQYEDGTYTPEGIERYRKKSENAKTRVQVYDTVEKINKGLYRPIINPVASTALGVKTFVVSSALLGPLGGLTSAATTAGLNFAINYLGSKGAGWLLKKASKSANAKAERYLEAIKNNPAHDNKQGGK